MPFLRHVYGSFHANKGLEDAKSLTFTSLFAVIPLLTLIISILSVFPAFQVFGNEIQAMILERLLPSSSRELEEYLTSFSTQARHLTWAGVSMLIITSYLMLRNIERSFNEIWGVRELRKGLNSFLLYWSVLSLGPFLIVLGLSISSYVTSLTLFEAFTDISDTLGTTNIVLEIFPLILTACAFTLLYVAVPNCAVKLWHGFLGGLVVALAFMLVKMVFTWFISLASYEFVYGTFAAVPIFLLWIYICWLVILLGANLVKSLPAFGTTYQGGRVHPVILSMALLHRLWEVQQDGGTLKVRVLNQEKWPFRDIQLKDILGVFADLKIIRSCGPEEYVLTRDLENVSMWKILSVLPWPMPGARDFDLIPDIVARNLPAKALLKQGFGSLEAASEKEFSASVSSIFRQP